MCLLLSWCCFQTSCFLNIRDKPLFLLRMPNPKCHRPSARRCRYRKRVARFPCGPFATTSLTPSKNIKSLSLRARRGQARQHKCRSFSTKQWVLKESCFLIRRQSRIEVKLLFYMNAWIHYPPWKRGDIGLSLSVCPSVRPSVCPAWDRVLCARELGMKELS